MDINSWFASSGTFADGVLLYSKTKGCNANLLRSFSKENSSNFLKLKYELKKAELSGSGAIIPKAANIATVPEIEPKKEPLLEHIIKESAAVSFKKETMAIYPMELHSTYRERVHNFYTACELKFQLNAVPDDDEHIALKLIIQLEDLWTRIDRAWMILDHWKDHGRMMPTEESEDFSKLSGVQLAMMRNRLESRISKRQKTIETMEQAVKASPEDRSLMNLLNRKLEQLQQLQLDLETIRNLLKNE